MKLDPQNLNGAQKAAVFLLSMGEQYASEIFKKMSDSEIKKVASAMAEINQVPAPVLSAVLEEFISAFEAEDRLIVQGDAFIKNAIENALDPEKAQKIFSQISERKLEKPFFWSRDVDVVTLTEHIKDEHPQTIAMILAHLPSDIAADIMVTLPDDKKGDIAIRIARLGQVPEDIIREVDHALRSGLSKIGKSGAEVGGLEALVNILNCVDKNTEDIVFDTIEEEQVEMANEIRDMMFVFEDLVRVDDRGMREILKKVEGQQLTLAMKTASEDLKQKIFSNLSSRAGEMLREDLEVMGPARLSEVEAAQQEILRAAKELEAEGTIVLGGKGKEDVLV